MYKRQWDLHSFITFLIYCSDNSDSAEFFIPFLQHRVDVRLSIQLGKLVAQCARHIADKLCGGCALLNDAFDHTEAVQVLRGDMQRVRCLRLALGVLPENGRAAARRNNRIQGVLEHEHTVCHRQRQCAAGAALTRHDRDNRRFQLDKIIQTAGNGLALTAFLRANAAERAAGVNKVDDRAVEFLRLMCETQGLSIALRVRHAEVGVHILLNGAALAVADYRHRCAVEVANAAEDGMVCLLYTSLPEGQEKVPHPTIWRYMTIIPDKNTITRFIPRSFSILNSPLLHKKDSKHTFRVF